MLDTTKMKKDVNRIRANLDYLDEQISNYVKYYNAVEIRNGIECVISNSIGRLKSKVELLEDHWLKGT